MKGKGQGLKTVKVLPAERNVAKDMWKMCGTVEVPSRGSLRGEVVAVEVLHLLHSHSAFPCNCHSLARALHLQFTALSSKKR